MPIHHRHGGHRIRKEARKQPIQLLREERRDRQRVFEVQAVGIELGQGGGGEDYAGGVLRGVFEDVEGGEERGAHGGGEAVVWGRGDGEEVG